MNSIQDQKDCCSEYEVKNIFRGCIMNKKLN